MKTQIPTIELWYDNGRTICKPIPTDKLLKFTWCFFWLFMIVTLIHTKQKDLMYEI